MVSLPSLSFPVHWLSVIVPFDTRWVGIWAEQTLSSGLEPCLAHACFCGSLLLIIILFSHNSPNLGEERFLTKINHDWGIQEIQLKTGTAIVLLFWFPQCTGSQNNAILVGYSGYEEFSLLGENTVQSLESQQKFALLAACFMLVSSSTL
jgi:hypothetical protein